MRKALAALILSCSLVGAGSAFAADPEIAFERGDFLAAADAGEAAGDQASLSVAAKALLALCINDLRGPQTGARLDRAQHNAEAAMKLAPEAVEPRLQLAVALGMKSRRAGIGEALKQNYAARGKALIGQALKMAPDDARAHALLGGWNLEVVRRGGAVGARLLGASPKAGFKAFDNARALAPSNPAIALHYAVALLSLDAKRYEQQAGALLIAASHGVPHDAFETAMQEEARRLSALMTARGAEAAAQSAAAAFL